MKKYFENKKKHHLIIGGISLFLLVFAIIWYIFSLAYEKSNKDLNQNLYIKNITIFSSNKVDKFKAYLGDVVTISFDTDSYFQNYLQVSLLNKFLTPVCSPKSEDNSKSDTENLDKVNKKNNKEDSSVQNYSLTESKQAEIIYKDEKEYDNKKDIVTKNDELDTLNNSDPKFSELKSASNVLDINNNDLDKMDFKNNSENKEKDYKEEDPVDNIYPVNCYVSLVVDQNIIDNFAGKLAEFIISLLPNEKVLEQIYFTKTDDGSFVEILADNLNVVEFKNFNKISISSNNVLDSKRVKTGEIVNLQFSTNLFEEKDNISFRVKLWDKEVNPSCSQYFSTVKGKGNLRYYVCSANILAENDMILSLGEQKVPFEIIIESNVDDNNSIILEKVINQTTDGSYVIPLLSKIDSTLSDNISVSNTNNTSNNIGAVILHNNNGAVIKEENKQNNNSDNSSVIKKKDCPYIVGFYRLNSEHPNIAKIRAGINETLGTKLPINNKFDNELFEILKVWQAKYKDMVLAPWGIDEPTGYFYKTSNWTMNYLMGCEIPKFVLEKFR